MKESHSRKATFNHDQLGTSTFAGRTRDVLTGSARRLIRLHGYSLRLNMYNTTPVAGNAWEVILALTTQRRAHTFTSLTQLTGLGTQTDWEMGHQRQTLLDYVYMQNELNVDLNNGSISSIIQPWVPCDLLVPSLATYMGQDIADVALVTWGVVIEYTWEEATPGEIAATNLHWGMDANDFDQEGTQEV